jgi:hypothetical protein
MSRRCKATAELAAARLDHRVHMDAPTMGNLRIAQIKRFALDQSRNVAKLQLASDMRPLSTGRLNWSMQHRR